MIKLILTLCISVSIGMIVAMLLPFWANGILFGVLAVGFWYFITYMQVKLEKLQKSMDVLVKDTESMEMDNG